MDKFLFYITCTTCQARLKVRDASVIGAILSCPKCESMVQVVPPPGWQSGDGEQVAEKPAPSGSAEPNSVAAAVAVSGAFADDHPPGTSAGAKKLIQNHEPLTPNPSPTRGEGSFQTPSQQGSGIGNRLVSPPSPPGTPLPAAIPGEGGAPPRVAPPVVAAAAAAIRPSTAAAGPDAEFLEAAGACLATPIPWQRWLFFASTPLVAAMLVVGWWMARPPRVRARPAVVSAPLPRERVGKEEPLAADVKPEPTPGPLDPRWMPDGAKMVLNLQLSRFAAVPEMSRLTEQAAPFWRASIEAVLRGFGLKMDSVRRLSWASTELSDWPNWSVVVIELEQQHDAGLLKRLGQPTDIVLADVACRRASDGPWTHPFAVLDAHTIVTGRDELLRKLSQRHGPADAIPAMELLGKAMAGDASFALRVDLTAARVAGWQLPTLWMDVWPAGRPAWHVLWEMPEAAGLSIEPSPRMVGELALACPSPSVAEKVRVALEEFLPAARKGLAARAETITARLRDGGLTAATADQYALILKQAEAVLASARPQQSANLVRLQTAWEQAFAELARAALESRGAIASDWYRAARSCDEANQRQLLSGWNGYHKAEGRFPEAASGASVLPAETRLSWIATLLPYYGQSDWHRRLEFGYAWNSPQNRPITARPLEAVINPALGPSTTAAGFPVTHYVGVAGLGSDAGDLKTDDPRAGAFGNGRTTRWQDMTRGAGNTIAILGAAQQLGAWAAGGHATVRGLTKAPYVNGPDGFGSGQPNGMLAGMADGSVRFISKDADPRMIEQLVTLHGGGNPSAAALDPRPAAKPESKPAPERAAKVDPVDSAAKPAAGDPPATLAIVSEPPALPAPPSERRVADVGDAAEDRPEIDVQERLANVVPKIVFHDVPLTACLGTVGDLSGLAITLDLDAMQRLGLKPEEPIRMRLEESTVRQILETLAAKLGLAVVLENGQVLLTSPREERENLRTMRYSVSDLARGDAATALVELIRELVAPESWKQSGGRGTIHALGDALIVAQTTAVHDQVISFCEKLRTARKLPLRSQYDPHRFALTTRLQRVGPALNQAVTINFHQPARLARIVSALEEVAGVKLMVNWVALGGAHLWPEVKGTVSLQRQPLAVVLDDLLRPLGLGYLAIDEGLIEITTRRAIAGRLELEFYPVQDLLAAAWTGPALLERIKSGVAKASWNDAGGAGVVRLDEPSGQVIVLQSQPVQGAIERLLTELHAQKKPAVANDQRPNPKAE